MAQRNEISKPKHVEQLYRPLLNVPFEGTYSGLRQFYEKEWETIMVDSDSDFAVLLASADEIAYRQIWKGFTGKKEGFSDYKLFVEMVGGHGGIVEGEQCTFTIIRMETFSLPPDQVEDYSALLGAVLTVSS